MSNGILGVKEKLVMRFVVCTCIPRQLLEVGVRGVCIRTEVEEHLDLPLDVGRKHGPTLVSGRGCYAYHLRWTSKVEICI